MAGLELVVALCAAVLLGGMLARRLGVAAPVILVIAGLLLSLLPVFSGVVLPPEAVLLLFLPALLYWESLTTSLREIRRFIRGVFLTGTVLVVVTAGAVAVVAHALGVKWEAAWIIGAAVAPTDAAATAALSGAMARQQITVLRAESLINDGTALVVYGLAVGAATGDARLGTLGVAGFFLVSFFGGIGVGLLTGWAVFQVRRRITDPLFANVGSLLTPFVAYLLAEAVHASGVLAVVTCGLYMSQVTPRVVAAVTRQQGAAFWTLSTFLLNGALFVLVGIQVPASVRALDSGLVGVGLIVVGAVYVSILLVRFGFLVTSAYLIRAVDRRPQQRLLRTTNRARLVSTVAGLRGAVSLAVALAVPEFLPNGSAFPDRDLIVFVVAGVVVASLILQGLALPRVIRWAQIPSDTSLRNEVLLARRTATEEALAALPELAAGLDVPEDITGTLRYEYEEHLRATLADQEGVSDHPALVRIQQYTQLKLAMIATKRATVVRLRDQRIIDDSALRIIQAQLDAEEVRLRPPPPEE
ncbi:MAG: Na+/H+ antiporter [Brooklawnia sp.]|nr:Na+/H+ antiporter [Brooklawnia sp.]